MPADAHARAKTGGAGGTQRCSKGSQATSGGGEGELSGRRLRRGRGKGREVSESRERGDEARRLARALPKVRGKQVGRVGRALKNMPHCVLGHSALGAQC